MKRYWLQIYFASVFLTWLVLLFAALGVARGEEQPPYEVPDVAISENFRRIYQIVDQLRQNDGSRIFVSSGNSTQFNNADVYGSSVTLAANASAIVAVVGLKANWIPIFSEMNTSSKTVTCRVWASSFTLTNTSGADSKTVNWWIFGRR